LKSKITEQSVFQIETSIAQISAARAKNTDPATREFQRKTLENLEIRLQFAVKDRNAKAEEYLREHGGADWWQAIAKLYPITFSEELCKHIVTSKARDWEDELCWEFAEKYEAVEKVQQLIVWLNQNRERGFGDRDADLVKLAQ